MIYGGSPWGFFLDHKMPDYSIERWNEICEAFYKKYAVLAEWQRRNIRMVLHGQEMVLFTGRRFKFYKTKYKDGIWQYNENQMKNYPVQGLAGGDILPLVVTIIRKGLQKYGLQSCMILTVHDSLVLDLISSEINKVAKLCHSVGDNLSDYVKAYFGYETAVKNFGGEFKIGDSYGKLRKLT
jgi:DNA polymerase I-like protein with 3'-5' exonuclease and polymerase domains